MKGLINNWKKKLKLKIQYQLHYQIYMKEMLWKYQVLIDLMSCVKIIKNDETIDEMLTINYFNFTKK